MISINARFLTQPLTGVQRYSLELINSLDHLVRPDQMVAYCPNGEHIPIDWKNIRLEERGPFNRNIWEQITLPILTRGSLLFSPSNIGPYLSQRQIATIHDANVFATREAYSWPFRIKYQLTYRRLAHIARHIFTVSEFSKSELIKYCGMRPELLEVIYPGREHFERIEPDKAVLDKYHLGTKPFLLTVGSNSPHKNFSGLYEVIKRINPQDYEVVVVGGTYNTVFQQADGDAEIPSCVRRLGYVTDPELKALYQHATAFILPTKYEGFGFPVLEAMTCGCPVVCSHVASLPEVGGDAVLYFDPYQSDDMEDKINQIMSTESLRNELIHLGKVQTEKFSWQQTAAKVWASLKEFI